MTAVLAVGCAVLGLLVGAFLNVLIDRVPEKQALRVGCRSCDDATAIGRGLRIIPWVVQGRRCRWCEQPVSHRYALVEVATAVLFAGAALRLGADAALPAYLVFLACLLTVSLIDLEHQIIPNRIVYPTVFVSVPLLAVAAVAQDDFDALGNALLGAVLAWAALVAVHLVSPQGMGFGDVRLAFVLGLFLGWLGLDHVLFGVFLGFLLGAVVGVALMVFGRRGRKDAIPFGPFLAAGAALAVFFGAPILRWWTKT